MDTARLVEGEGHSPKVPGLISWDPWKDDCGGDQTGKASRDWAHFESTTNGDNGADWAVGLNGFGETGTVGSRPSENVQVIMEPKQSVTDKRLVSMDRNDLLSAKQDSENFILDAPATASAYTVDQPYTSAPVVGSMCKGLEASKDFFGTNEYSDWQAFASFDVEQSHTSEGSLDNVCSTALGRSHLEDVSDSFGRHLPHEKPQVAVAGDAILWPLSSHTGEGPAASDLLATESETVFKSVFVPAGQLNAVYLEESSCESASTLPGFLNQRKSSSPDQLTAEFSSVEERLCRVLFPAELCSLEDPSYLQDLPVDANDGFDWTKEPDRAGSVSPDFLPSIFRPKRDSVVDIEFDHSRAAAAQINSSIHKQSTLGESLDMRPPRYTEHYKQNDNKGLAFLSVEELQTMCDEMTRKFERLSDELVTELQERDLVASEMDAKNRFISSILKVQAMRHSVRNGSSGNSIDVKLKTLSWSRATRAKEDKQCGKYLNTIIPYVPPEDTQWSASTLRQLTKILQAIAEDSDNVPSLVSDYLQSEVLVSPIKVEPHTSLDNKAPV